MDYYPSGTNMKAFKHLPEISKYNSNYYVGNDNNLLYGSSDDDNTTEWYLVSGKHFIYLGESYTSDNDELFRYESPRT